MQTRVVLILRPEDVMRDLLSSSLVDRDCDVLLVMVAMSTRLFTTLPHWCSLLILCL